MVDQQLLLLSLLGLKELVVGCAVLAPLPQKCWFRCLCSWLQELLKSSKLLITGKAAHREPPALLLWWCHNGAAHNWGCLCMWAPSYLFTPPATMTPERLQLSRATHHRDDDDINIHHNKHIASGKDWKTERLTKQKRNDKKPNDTSNGWKSLMARLAVLEVGTEFWNYSLAFMENHPLTYLACCNHIF